MGSPDLKFENGTARLGGDLTFSTVSALFHEMESIARKGGLPTSIDLSGVGQIDSAGLALLLEWQSEYRRQAGGEALMDIRSAPEALMKIARLCDAEGYLVSNAAASGSEGRE